MSAFHNDHGSSSSSTSFSSSAGPSTSTTSLSLPMHKSPSPPRRIRFAPLLDPRRAVVVTDDGHELPIKDDTHFPAATSLAVLHNHNPVSPLTSCSDPDPQYTSLSTPSSSPITSNSSPPCSPRPHSRSFTVNILKPFKRPPSPNTPKARKSKSLSITPEEILTLGTINLFRSSTLSSNNSKENNNPSSPPRLWGHRRTSATSISSSNTPQIQSDILDNNPPLIRSQSVQEPTDRKKKRSSITAFFSSAPGVSSLVDFKPKTTTQTTKPKHSMTPTSSSPLPSSSTITNGGLATPTRTSFLTPSQRTSRHKGTKMLNGRVYGAKRNSQISQNPFANARDDEPEFVEWGYGGMGSVKGARSAGVVGNDAPGTVNWERLLGGSEVSAQGHRGWAVPGGGRGGAGARVKKGDVETRERRSGESEEEKVGGGDGEEDDGSGLAWVRRRRKMKEEKEKKMKENEYAKTQGSHGPESVPTSPSTAVSQVADSATQTTITGHDRDQSKGGPAVGDEHRHDQNNLSQNSGVNGHHDHVMKAVSVPMPPRQPSHHRKPSNSRTLSQGAETGMTVATTHNTHNKFENVSPRDSQTAPAGSESSSSSVSESSDDEGTSDGEDSSEEDQDEAEKRRTAICAGVEKVAASFRHRGE